MQYRVEEVYLAWLALSVVSPGRHAGWCCLGYWCCVLVDLPFVKEAKRVDAASMVRDEIPNFLIRSSSSVKKLASP